MGSQRLNSLTVKATDFDLVFSLPKLDALTHACLQAGDGLSLSAKDRNVIDIDLVAREGKLLIADLDFDLGEFAILFGFHEMHFGSIQFESRSIRVKSAPFKPAFIPRAKMLDELRRAKSHAAEYQ